MSEIRQGLAGKRIYVLPYNHADYAWQHARAWHLKRYLAVFDRMLMLFDRHPEFCSFYDSWSECLGPCLEARPERRKRFAELLAQGRLAIVGGHWSNLRMDQAGDETSVRNMVYGRRRVRELFPGARLDAYANLDVVISHSQVPQLLRLGGYRCLFAWRPQQGMDDQGVPRSFFWRGLSGDTVLVTRHSYGGWAHGVEFYDTDAQPDAPRDTVDMDHVVRFAWDRYLRVPCAQPGLQTVSMCQGGDDALPFADQFHGFERDIVSITREWNRIGMGEMRLGTPYDVFDALWAQKDDLPTWQGVLDPAGPCYHMARNGQHGLWWLRERADREIVLAEMLATRAALDGHAYPADAMDTCWQRHLSCSTHGMEYLFRSDFARIRRTEETVIDDARRIERDAVAALTRGPVPDDPSCLVVFNPLPESRRAVVLVHLDNIDNARRQPVLTDAAGTALLSQVVYANPLARDFDVLVETDLPAGAATHVHVDWSDRDVPACEPDTDETLDAELRSDRLRLVLRAGLLVRIEDQASGRVVQAPDGAGFLDPASLPQQIQRIVPVAFADNPEPFVATSVRVDQRGPLRWRLTREGTSGPHHFQQHLDLLRGGDTIHATTEVDVASDSTNIVLGVPLDPSAELVADIPFGVEPRDVASIPYGRYGDEEHHSIERRIPGLFWGKSWVYARTGDTGLGLITLDGPRYYRRYGDPMRLLHVLVSVKLKPSTGFLAKTHFGEATGHHVFGHQLVVAGGTWQEAGMVQRAQQARTPILVLPGCAQRLTHELRIDPHTVRVSAFYQDGRHVIVRVVNMDDTPTHATVRLPFHPASVEACDFLTRPVEADVSSADRTLTLDLRPWQIMTLRLAR